MDGTAALRVSRLLSAALLLGVGACSQEHVGSGAGILSEAAAPVFDFPTECPPGTMDACRAKLEAYPVAFGTERDRDAATPGGKKQRVLIIAYQGTREINASAPPASATLILHLANHGKVKTAAYDLDPQSQADYYVTVKNDGGAKWTLWRVPANDNGSVTVATSGSFIQCQPASTSQWAYSIADFASCANAPHLQNISMASLGGFSIKPLLNLFALFLDPPPVGEDGGWFSCDGGCCSLNMT